MRKTYFKKSTSATGALRELLRKKAPIGYHCAMPPPKRGRPALAELTPIAHPLDEAAFADRLRSLVQGTGLSSRRLGQLAGMTGNTVLTAMRGSSMPSVPHLVALVHALAHVTGHPVSWLLTHLLLDGSRTAAKDRPRRPR